MSSDEESCSQISSNNNTTTNGNGSSKPNQIGRILLDIPCKVCDDHSSGKHYGIYACDGCAGFFKRSIRRNRQYVCKSKVQGACAVDKTHRNQCRACRLRKCVEAGMNKDAVQHERGPRNSTIRKQMALYMKEAFEMNGFLAAAAAGMLPPSAMAMAAQRGMVGVPPPQHPSAPPTMLPVSSATTPALMPPPSPADPTALLQAALGAAGGASSNPTLIAALALMQQQQQQQQQQEQLHHHQTPLPDQRSPDALKMAFSSAVSGLIANINPSTSPGLLQTASATPRPTSSLDLSNTRKHSLGGTASATPGATAPKQAHLSPSGSSASSAGMISVQVGNATAASSTAALTPVTKGTKSEQISPEPPAKRSSTNGAEAIRESAARCLFDNVRWLRSLPALSTLSAEDQRRLLEASWKDLFVIGWQQFDDASSIDIQSVAVENNQPGHNSPSSSPSAGSDLGSSGSQEAAHNQNSSRQLTVDVEQLAEIADKFRQVNPDLTEFTCLKAIALFQSASGDDELRSKLVISALHEQAQMTLARYVQAAHPDDSLRLGKLMLLLMATKACPIGAVENVFFKKTIGCIEMSRLVYDLFQSSDI